MLRLMVVSSYKGKIVSTIYFAILISSTWFWRILESSFFIAIILTITGYLLVLSSFSLVAEKIKLVGYFILPIIAAFLMVNNFNSDLFIQTGTERSLYEQRKEVSSGVGRLFVNEAYFSFLKVQRSFLTNLDFNQYFFGGAPRFRDYATDFDKFYFIFLPSFMVGIVVVSQKLKEYKFLLLSGVLVLLFATFTRMDITNGIYTLFPIIVCFIVLGTYSIIFFVLRKVMRK